LIGWRHHYNTRRPHSALGYQLPAPDTIVPKPAAMGCAIDGLRPSPLAPIAQFTLTKRIEAAVREKTATFGADGLGGD
jgi:hypothetical protein